MAGSVDFGSQQSLTTFRTVTGWGRSEGAIHEKKMTVCLQYYRHDICIQHMMPPS